MQRSLRIAVLNPSYEESNSPFSEYDSYCDPGPYWPEHTLWERIFIHKKTSVQQIEDLANQNFDLFFNLCDGAQDEERAGLEVVMALEKFGCAFTGATSSFYEPTRESMKEVCRAAGIKTPKYVFAKNESHVQKALALLQFPMIVKHENSYGSIGMGKSARVTNPADLQKEVHKMCATYGGALIEEFIEGREFTVLVAENPLDPSQPLTFTSVECQFPPGETFKHFDFKWVDCEEMTWKAVEDQSLDQKLQEMSKIMFQGHQGTGYARCDIRMDDQSNLYMLEINPNCGIFYPKEEYGSADSILFQDPKGHRFFLSHQIEVALRRKKIKIV